jgi:hypothetical protein
VGLRRKKEEREGKRRERKGERREKRWKDGGGQNPNSERKLQFFKLRGKIIIIIS